MFQYRRKTVFLACVCFAAYLCFLIYILFFMEARANTYREYNLIPFKSIRMFFEYYFVHHDFSFFYCFLFIFGNVFLLLPFGFLLPIIIQRRLSLLRVLLASFCLTAAIELTQFYTGLGEMDIDDVILNVLGAAVGFGLERCFSAWLVRHRSVS